MKDGAKAQMIALMRKMINRTQEDKFRGWQILAGTVFNNNISASPELYPVILDIPEGTAYNQRLGNQVRPKYLTVKGMIAIDKSVDYPIDLECRAFLLTDKSHKTNVDVQNRSDVNHLLDDGISTGPFPYDGTVKNHLALVNREQYTVLKDKRFKLSHNIFAASQAEFTRPEYHRFSWTVKVPTLKFDSDAGDTATNFAPFFALGWVQPNNYEATSITTPVSVVLTSVLHYEDA